MKTLLLITILLLTGICQGQKELLTITASGDTIYNFENISGLHIGSLNEYCISGELYTPPAPMHYIEITNKEGETVLTMDSTFTITSYRGEIILTLNDLLEYRQECYNDSTLMEHQHYMPEGETFCIVDWECLNKNHYRDCWAHKDPTFEGYNKWLKKKLHIK